MGLLRPDENPHGLRSEGWWGKGIWIQWTLILLNLDHHHSSILALLLHLPLPFSVWGMGEVHHNGQVHHQGSGGGVSIWHTTFSIL